MALRKSLGRVKGEVWLSRWLEPARIRQHEDKILLLLTLVIGAIVGLVIVAFILVTENLGSRMYPAETSAWRRVLIPVLGSLLTGFLLYRYFPDARGSGIPQTKAALYLRDGFISLRTVLGKFGLSSVSLASGIALGREGPAVQVGAGIASVLGRRLGLSPSKVQALVPVGASAALAAAFNTPIAAVLFSLEEVMGDLHARVLGSVVLSSATSWIVLHLLLGDEPLFHVPAYQMVHPVEFFLYALMGVVGGLISVSFVKLLLWLRMCFRRMPGSTEWYQPVAGGLLVGLIGWFVPEVLGVGYGHVSRALNGQTALGVMALLVALKLLATAGCYASGNAGGIFGPSLFIGAMMGGAFGSVMHSLLPDYTGSIGAYALVGMGTAFAGIIRVPLTSVIMIFEVTRDYSIIVPLMISNLTAYFISARLQRVPIYEALQEQEGVHLPSAVRDREGLLTASHALHPAVEVLPAGLTVDEAIAAGYRDAQAWPVTDTGGLLGMLSLTQLEAAVRAGLGGRKLGELTTGSYPYVHSDQPLDRVMQRMADAGCDVLPVVSRANVRELLGVVSLKDILAAYGLGEGRRPAAGVANETTTPAGGLARIIAAVAGILLLSVLLSYFYRLHRADRAKESFQQGNRLAGEGRYPEAIERYRNALSVSHSAEHRLALGLALVEAGRLNEAEVYLREVLRASPRSGPANLGLARIAAGQGRMQEAITFYHGAVYGSWPGKPGGNRVQARIELVRFLGKAGRRTQAQGELLSLLAEMPDDPVTRKQIGRLLLDFGLPGESAGVFRDIVKQNRQDAEAYAALAEAEMANNDYLSARDAFRHALQINPGDSSARTRLELCEQVLALDPTLRRLSPAERFRRSGKLVEAALQALDRCTAASPGAAVPTPVLELEGAARAALSRRQKPPSLGDAAEANLLLAEQLWASRARLCGSTGAADEPLGRVMTRLSR